MSTQSKRNFRPDYHYTPPTGWINDPNGLVYENGTWYLFAQHNPVEPIWGPMHWRHAVSPDLLHWKDLGIAMAPDPSLGMIFSGSAVIDHGNTSGLGMSRDPMVLIYTHHGEWEQQSIAFSEDRQHFTPYAGNPVIPNREQQNFRDPKVFRNEKLNCWSLVLAAGDHAEFYASPDLIHWRKTGEFGRTENKLGGIFECADLFPLPAPDGRTVWVLIVSTALHPAFGSGRMQYFLGDFDGETFRETMLSPHPRIMDSGYDNYAAVTYANTPRRLMIGWSGSPGYAQFMPTNEFCCTMTYAREVSLKETDEGLKLAFAPVTPEFTLHPAEKVTVPENPLWPQSPLPLAAAQLPGDVFRIRVEAPSSFTLTLANDQGEKLNVSVSNEQCLTVDRSEAGIRGFNSFFESGMGSVMTARRSMHGPVVMDLYFDRMIAEIFTDEGTVVNTSLVFPEHPYTQAFLNGSGKLWVGGVS